MAGMLIVLTTVPDKEEGERLADLMIGRDLAACVQILPAMTSVYMWKGEIRRDNEHLLLIKTLDERFDELQAMIEREHSYDVPEVVAIRPQSVAAAYLGWMENLLG